jgi:enamine deaminase RidA (YjgF/YER057c/UK114 family)
MTDYHAAVEAAQLELDSALLALDQLYNNDISLREQQLRTQIRQLEADLHTYQDEYTTLTQRLEDTYQQKTSHLAQAERELSIATQDLALMQSGVHISSTSETEITANTLQQRDQTIDAIISDLQAIIVEIELVVESVDQIFGMSDIFHDQAEPYLPSLSARSTQLKKATNDHLRDTYKMIDQYTERISASSPSISDQEITSLIEQIYTDSQSLIILLDSAQDALDMTYVTPGRE